MWFRFSASGNNIVTFILLFLTLKTIATITKTTTITTTITTYASSRQSSAIGSLQRLTSLFLGDSVPYHYTCTASLKVSLTYALTCTTLLPSFWNNPEIFEVHSPSLPPSLITHTLFSHKPSSAFVYLPLTLLPHPPSFPSSLRVEVISLFFPPKSAVSPLNAFIYSPRSSFTTLFLVFQHYEEIRSLF